MSALVTLYFRDFRRPRKLMISTIPEIDNANRMTQIDPNSGTTVVPMIVT